MVESFIALELFCFRDEEHAGELIISQEPRHGTEKRYSSFSKDVVVCYYAPRAIFQNHPSQLSPVRPLPTD